MNEIEKVESDIKALLSSGASSNKISRSTGVTLSTISRIRSGKVDIDNVSFTNIKRLYQATISVNEKEK